MDYYKVRYGNNFRIVLAIILPMLLTVYPFILLMQNFPELSTLHSYLIIYFFLACIIALTFWLIKIMYPTVLVAINDCEINILFPKKSIFSGSDFTLKMDQIKSISCKDGFDFKSFKNGGLSWDVLNGDQYIVIKTTIRPRKFQLSASSYSSDDQKNFANVLRKISKFMP